MDEFHVCFTEQADIFSRSFHSLCSLFPCACQMALPFLLFLLLFPSANIHSLSFPHCLIKPLAVIDDHVSGLFSPSLSPPSTGSCTLTFYTYAAAPPCGHILHTWQLTATIVHTSVTHTILYFSLISVNGFALSLAAFTTIPLVIQIYKHA